MSIFDDLAKTASSLAEQVWESTPDTVKAQAQQLLSSQAQALINQGFRSVEIRTGVAPPIRFTAADLAGQIPKLPASQQQKVEKKAGANTRVVQPKQVGRSSLLDIVKPTIVIDSPLFDKPRVYSTEHGIAGPDDYKRFKFGVAMTVVGVLGLAFYAGRFYERKKR